MALIMVGHFDNPAWLKPGTALFCDAALALCGWDEKENTASQFSRSVCRLCSGGKHHMRPIIRMRVRHGGVEGKGYG